MPSNEVGRGARRGARRPVATVQESAVGDTCDALPRMLFRQGLESGAGSDKQLRTALPATLSINQDKRFERLKGQYMNSGLVWQFLKTRSTSIKK